MSQYWRGPPKGHVRFGGGYGHRRSDGEYLPVLSAPEPTYDEPCECTGLVHERDSRVCPDGGSAVTAVVEKRHRVEPVLTHAQMKKFKAEVRETLLTLVNTYGIDYRLQADGQHIFLYSGKRGERPFKAAASRQVPAQMRFLDQWIKENVPGYSAPTKERNVEATFKCAQGCKDESFSSVEEINEHYAKVHPPVPTPKEVMKEKLVAGVTAAHETGKALGDAIARKRDEVQWEEPPAKPEPIPWDGKDVEWAPYLYGNGKQSAFFEVTTDRSKPMVIRCTYPGCSFQRVDDFRGVHLHENKHTGKAAEYAAMGGEAARKLAEKSKKPVASATGQDKAVMALETLASIYGYVVVAEEHYEELTAAKADPMLETALRDEVARLEKELDETKAKLALIREAMSL